MGEERFVNAAAMPSDASHYPIQGGAMAKRRRQADELVRSEVLTVRLDQKLRFEAELAARFQRRPLATFIEWAVEEAVKLYQLPIAGNPTARHIGDAVWNVDEADRYLKLATMYPKLLRHKEQVLWKVLYEAGYTKGLRFDETTGRTFVDLRMIEALRQHWDVLKQIAAGESSRDQLPRWEPPGGGSAGSLGLIGEFELPLL